VEPSGPATDLNALHHRLADIPASPSDAIAEKRQDHL